MLGRGIEVCCGGDPASLRPDLEDRDDSAYAALSSSCVKHGLNSISSSTSNVRADSYLSFASTISAND